MSLKCVFKTLSPVSLLTLNAQMSNQPKVISGRNMIHQITINVCFAVHDTSPYVRRGLATGGRGGGVRGEKKEKEKKKNKK